MPRYSHTQTVSSIRSFYQFFSTLPSLPPEYIWEPPSSGWVEINSLSLSHLGKNKDVINLLRHIPYINDTQIAWRTRGVDYISEAVGDGRVWGEKDGHVLGEVVPREAGVLPESVVALTDGARCGSWLLLDTRAGTITGFNLSTPPEQDYPPRGHPDHWRAYLTLPTREFFEFWKEQYRSLAWVVMPDEEGSVLRGDEEGVDEIRAIYRELGWPYAFKREECKDALLRWKEERFRSRSGGGGRGNYY